MITSILAAVAAGEIAKGVANYHERGDYNVYTKRQERVLAEHQKEKNRLDQVGGMNYVLHAKKKPQIRDISEDDGLPHAFRTESPCNNGGVVNPLDGGSFRCDI